MFLAAWFALAVWSFAGDGVVDYLLFIVSGFVYIAVQILLPIGAAAVGITAIGIVFHIAEHAHVL